MDTRQIKRAFRDTGEAMERKSTHQEYFDLAVQFMEA
jgi:hypothetical protein